jgi:hypothetical protein
MVSDDLYVDGGGGVKVVQIVSVLTPVHDSVYSSSTYS